MHYWISHLPRIDAPLILSQIIIAMLNRVDKSVKSRKRIVDLRQCLPHCYVWTTVQLPFLKPLSIKVGHLSTIQNYESRIESIGFD